MLLFKLENNSSEEIILVRFEQNPLFQTVSFYAPDINQSIFYATLRWSKDNPILITSNDQNRPYHDHVSLLAVDATRSPWDHNAQLTGYPPPQLPVQRSAICNDT